MSHIVAASLHKNYLRIFFCQFKEYNENLDNIVKSNIGKLGH